MHSHLTFNKCQVHSEGKKKNNVLNKWSFRDKKANFYMKKDKFESLGTSYKKIN